MSQMDGREWLNFVALMAFVVFGLSYTVALAGTYELVGGREDSASAGHVAAQTWVTVAIVCVIAFVFSVLAAKIAPGSTDAYSQLSREAWRAGAEFSRAGAPKALTFERPPLATMRVTRSGPTIRESGTHPSGVTILSASVPAGDGANHPIGSCLAWCEVKGDLPPLSLVRGDVDPALTAALGDDEFDLGKYDLAVPWRAFGSAKACAEVFTPEMVEALSAEGDDGLVVHFEPHRVVVWSDREVPIYQTERLRGLAFSCVLALPRRLRNSGDRPSRLSDLDSGESGKLRRIVSTRVLRPVSRIRRRLLVSTLVLGGFSLPPIIVLVAYLFGGIPFRGDTGLLATGIIFALAVATAGPAWVSNVAMKRLDAKHEAIAREVLDVASDANLVFRPRASFLEQGWTRRPFAALKNLGAAPSGSANRDWGSVGVAYIEGDYGVWYFLVKAFQSRVAWAHVGGGLPRMDLVREGFSSRAAKFIGGTELDTESHEFNELWRIKTDHLQEAHALLQPRMIDFLTTTAEQGIAIHLDGDRVVIWDDGSDETIDLAARLKLVERFVDCLPRHSRPTGDRKQDAS